MKQVIGKLNKGVEQMTEKEALDSLKFEVFE